MKCSYCGEENPEGELFCSKCGMKIEAVMGAPEPERPEPPEPEPGKRCENCGYVNPEGASVCKGCNQPLEELLPEPLRVCPSCGFDKNPEPAKFCMSCGAQLPEPITPEPAVEPEPVPLGVCPSCGFDKNPESAKFCMSCGAQLPAPAPAVEPVEPEPEPGPAPALAKLVLPNSREIPISDPERIIGRGDFLQDLSPEEAKFISREHLTIICENEKYYITDEESTNGTTLNGTQIKGQGKQELTDNDEIALADTITVTFHC